MRPILFNVIYYPKLWYYPAFLALVFLFCEYFVYYFVLALCSWPSGIGTVRAMIFADPHLLGIRHGHWFDKLRREWQMYRSYVTALSYFDPDAVFVLGDLFDEAEWAKPDEFSSYVRRFRSLFPQKRSLMYAVPGNHDVGFHYAMISERVNWFKNVFGSDLVQLVSINHIHFVLINSMATANDGCHFCKEALEKLKEINKTLTCYRDQVPSDFCEVDSSLYYSKPIIMQHFPLFRNSDELCNEPDEAPADEKLIKFRENWESLSKQSTDKLFDLLQPRAAFSGHTHHGCLTYHTSKKIPEWTVSSFSWRNNKSPAFILAKISEKSFEVIKCYMPREMTIILVYVFSCFILFLWLFVSCSRRKLRALSFKSL